MQNNNQSLEKIETEKRLRRLKYLLYSSHQVCLELLLYTSSFYLSLIP